MQIWLDQVREEPFNWEETQDVAPDSLDRPELMGLGPVTWRGQVVWADPGYFLRARLSYEQTLCCDRCLKPMVEGAAAEVELVILVDDPQGRQGHHGRHGRRDRSDGAEHELDGDDLGTIHLESEMLDTQPILLEQLQLNIPMKPLCRPDCQGLCPQCGADLNLGACACGERAVDPRWASLAALKDRLAGGPGGQ